MHGRVRLDKMVGRAVKSGHVCYIRSLPRIGPHLLTVHGNFKMASNQRSHSKQIIPEVTQKFRTCPSDNAGVHDVRRVPHARSAVVEGDSKPPGLGAYVHAGPACSYKTFCSTVQCNHSVQMECSLHAFSMFQKC